VGSAAAAFKGGRRPAANGYMYKGHAHFVAGGGWSVGAMVLGRARLGGASFTDVTSSAGVGDETNSIGTSWADYDGDGDLDQYMYRGPPGTRDS